MMWRKDKNGTLIGVLNDYDLSSLATAQGPLGNERTGTVPFMSLDLLTKRGQRGEVEHLYRHDLESFMWVLAWVFLRYKDGELLTSGRPFDEWATKDAETVGKEKLYFLLNFLDFKPPDIDMRMWSLLADCLMVVRKDAGRRLDLLLGLSRKLAQRAEIVVQIERDDAYLLNLFTSTEGWVELSESLQ
jgi:hypothetical protein